MGRFSDALSLVATTSSALYHAQYGVSTFNPQDVSDGITTLEHGLRALRSVYDELDVAIRELRP